MVYEVLARSLGTKLMHLRTMHLTSPRILESAVVHVYTGLKFTVMFLCTSTLIYILYIAL